MMYNFSDALKPKREETMRTDLVKITIAKMEELLSKDIYGAMHIIADIAKANPEIGVEIDSNHRSFEIMRRISVSTKDEDYEYDYALRIYISPPLHFGCGRKYEHIFIDLYFADDEDKELTKEIRDILENSIKITKNWTIQSVIDVLLVAEDYLEFEREQNNEESGENDNV